MRLLTSCQAVSVAAIIAASIPAIAASDDQCVRIIGTESSGEQVSMDPANQLSSDDAILVYAVYNRLLDVDENLQVVPELAVSWEASDDGKTWTFHLREGVKFHDGSDFDAGDVVYSFRRLLDPELASPALANLGFLKPEGINAVDDHTVTFTTDEINSELPLFLTLKWNLIVAEGATHEALRLHGNGTGPFIQEQFRPGDPVRIVRRNPNYWKPGLPKADCLKSSIVTESLTAALAMQSGQADLLLNVEPSQVEVMKHDPNIQLLETGAGTSMTFGMFIDEPPFDDERVRKAMKLVVDRDVLVNTVMLGYAEVGNDNPIPPSWPIAFTDTPLERDVEQARALLAEAGYPDGLEIELYTAEAMPNQVKLAEAYAQMAADAGMKVEIINTPADSYWSDVWNKHPFTQSAYFIRPPGEAMSLAYAKDAPWNDTHWYRDDFDALLTQAAGELDPEKRVEIYKKAQRLLSEEGGVIIPLFIHQVSALNGACSGYTPHAQTANLDFEEITCSR